VIVFLNFSSDEPTLPVKEQGASDPHKLITSKKGVTFGYLPMNDNVKGMYQY
jgi:hypothetical protein